MTSHKMLCDVITIDFRNSVKLFIFLVTIPKYEELFYSIFFLYRMQVTILREERNIIAAIQDART